MKMNFNRITLLFLVSVSLTIAQDKIENKANLIQKVDKTDGTTAINDKVEFKNSSGNSIITITDEGSNAGSILIPESSPSSTTNKLYNESGTLKFNGSVLGTAGGADSINQLADAKYDGSSLYLGEEAGVNDNGNSNFNVGVGYNSLYSNTKGEKNTSIGYRALLFNTSGSFNTAIGYQSLYSNISGAYNSANGNEALYSNTSGGFNTAFGYKALNSNTVGNNNTSIGRTSLIYNTTGGYNTSLGASALGYNTTGNNNVGVGYFANSGNQEGSNNTMIGFGAGGTSSTHSKNGNLFLGYMAGYHETDDNKLYINNDSSANPLIWGDFTDGSEEVKINGDFHVTGNITTDGSGLGATEINHLTDAKYDGNSLFLGVGAGSINSGLYNTALGVLALSANSFGELNSAIGTQALSSNTDGNRNTASGYQALNGNTTGSGNTANGYQALSGNTIGNYNVGIGNSSNILNQEGSKNTIIGFEAGRGNNNHNKSGSVFIGYQAGYEEETDNKLYIENSNSSSPLIYGDFDTDDIKINGNLEVTEKTQIGVAGVPITEIKIIEGNTSTMFTIIPYPLTYTQANTFLVSCKYGPPSGSGTIWRNVADVSFTDTDIVWERSGTSTVDYKLVIMKID